MKFIWRMLCVIGSLLLTFGLVQFVIDYIYEHQGKHYITSAENTDNNTEE